MGKKQAFHNCRTVWNLRAKLWSVLEEQTGCPSDGKWRSRVVCYQQQCVCDTSLIWQAHDHGEPGSCDWTNDFGILVSAQQCTGGHTMHVR